MRATIVGSKGQGGLMKAMGKSAGARGGPNPQQMAQMQQHVSIFFLEKRGGEGGEGEGESERGEDKGDEEKKTRISKRSHHPFPFPFPVSPSIRQ
jgi:hypothetical protein